MKRIEGILSKTYKCPKLYLEDIERILEILDEAKIREIDISAEGYSYNNIEELEEKKTKINNLFIKTHQPYINIEFTKDGSRFYIGSDDLKSRGIFSSINEIISRRERKFLWILTIHNIFANILIVTSWLLSRIYDKEYPNYIIKNIIFVLIGLFLFWTPISILVHWKFYSLINLMKKDKISNFFIRNKDNIIISTIFTIFGISLGIIIQRFLLS